MFTKKTFFYKDYYLKANSVTALQEELKAFDASFFITTDEENNEIIRKQSLNHALHIVGDEIDKQATQQAQNEFLQNQQEGESNPDADDVPTETTPLPVIYTGKILVNLRLHDTSQEALDALTQAFENHNWIDVEIINPQPTTPNCIFG